MSDVQTPAMVADPEHTRRVVQLASRKREFTAPMSVPRRCATS
jgi:hypothetical protein